jgi:toxin-antitoxin system PIN domain toxin
MIELPDVNVLVALVWESHVHHAAARRWFGTRSDDSFATCAMTQAGFVRVSSNPQALPQAISVGDAIANLTVLTHRDDHVFLADGYGFVGNPHIDHARIVGHRQVTDAVIVAVARQHGARVVTLDSGLAQLGGSDVLRIA